MSSGIVKEYDPARGAGSIVDSESNADVAVYANHLNLKQGEVLKKGQDVEYDIETDRHSNRAVNVRITIK